MADFKRGLAAGLRSSVRSTTLLLVLSPLSSPSMVMALLAELIG